MPETEHRLQVLIANEKAERLESITAIVENLGHEIVGRGVEVTAVGPLSRSTGAEVALVGLGLDNDTRWMRSPPSFRRRRVRSSHCSTQPTRPTSARLRSVASLPTSS